MFTTSSVLPVNSVDTGSALETTSTFTITRCRLDLNGLLKRIFRFVQLSEEQKRCRCCAAPTTRSGWSLPLSLPTQTNLLNSGTGGLVVTSTPPTTPSCRTRTARAPPSHPYLALHHPRPQQRRVNAPPCPQYHLCGLPYCKPSPTIEKANKERKLFLLNGCRVVGFPLKALHWRYSASAFKAR